MMLMSSPLAFSGVIRLYCSECRCEARWSREELEAAFTETEFLVAAHT